MPLRTETPSFGDCFSTSLNCSTISLTWAAGLVPHFGPTSAINARSASGMTGNREVMRLRPCKGSSDCNAGEFELRELFDRVAYAFTSHAAALHPAERIKVETKPRCLVDPECADLEI